MTQRIAIYHNRFDPPTVHHRHIAERLSETFDRVIVVPSGPRCGPRAKPGEIPDSRAIHRATMADLNFRGLKKCIVDLTDLERQEFTPPVALAERYVVANSEVWHVVSTDWIRDGATGQSVIQKEWDRGTEEWMRSGFVVLREHGEPLEVADLPPRHVLLEHTAHMPGNTIRMMLTQWEPVDDYLHPPVAAYIQRHGLFRDVPQSERTTFKPSAAQFQLYVNGWNKKSTNYAQLLAPYTIGEPTMIVPIGGDGTMLRAIRKHWRDRLPFFGINTGGLGFLLSGREVTAFWEQELLLYHLPLLQVQAVLCDGTIRDSVAFNEAWVERATGQTAWVRVKVNGVERIPQLVGDGVLVSTAAGSTSYARAMGASPVPLNTEVLLLVGSNVLKPAFWRPAVLPLDAEVVLEAVEPNKRPLHGYCDGEMFPEPVQKLTIRVSRTAAIELAFTRDHDPFAKLAQVQFPANSGD